MDEFKIQALKKRLKDTGWGRAFAHLIPFYGIYYAVTRRTITPLVWDLTGSFTAGFIIGFAMISADATESSIDATVPLVSFAITPLLAKQGIDRARIFARVKLRDTSNSNNRDTSSKITNNQNLLGLRFGEEAKRTPATPSLETKNAYAKLKFGDAAKGTAPQHEWQDSRSSELNKIKSKEDNKKMQALLSQNELSLANENQAIKEEGRPEEAPNENEKPKETYKKQSNDLDELEITLKRYSDMHEKGLIEKDEYDALRKREMGL